MLILHLIIFNFIQVKSALRTMGLTKVSKLISKIGNVTSSLLINLFLVNYFNISHNNKYEHISSDTSKIQMICRETSSEISTQ